MSRKKTPTRICIVSDELNGPTRNGGIGTHVYWLSRELAIEGLDVTILFSGHSDGGQQEHWTRQFAAAGITLVFLSELPDPAEPLDGPTFFQISFKVFRYLRNQDFQAVHFQDWHANGYHTVLARRNIGEFSDTLLTLTLHSSTQWIDEAMRQWPKDPVENAKLRYCEAQCAEGCDVVVSPSHYMLDYVKRIGWTLPTDTRVIPNPYRRKDKKSLKAPAAGVLAYFGRLETRKGLVLLLDALARLSPESRRRIRKLHFVGKVGTVNGESALKYVASRTEELGIQAECITSLDSSGAIEFLRKSRAIVLCPSLVDNYPYALVECGMEGLPVLASDSGGAREIVSPTSLVQATSGAWARKIDDVLSGRVAFGKSFYSPVASVSAWKRLSLERRPRTVPTRATKALAKKRQVPLPKVSVCIPYFNAGEYIEELVESLKSLTYQNLEFILVNDCSTDEQSRRMFDGIARRADKRFKFLHMKENGGAGAARNRAVGAASGEYLMFVDADNVVRPEMVDRFVHAIEHSAADAATCYFVGFSDGAPRLGRHPQAEWSYMPLGPSRQIGCLENVFGDTNFIVRREVFDRLGGWRSEPGFGWADWQFLASLVLGGHKLVVVPEFLFWYRNRKGSLRSQMSDAGNHLLMLRAYQENVPPWVASLITDLLLPLYVGRKSSAEWIVQAELDGYLPEVEFVANFLRDSRIGQFIRASEPTKDLIERVTKFL